MQRKESSIGMIKLSRMVKVQVRIKKVSRKMKQSLHQVRIRRQHIGKIFSVTIVRSGDTMPLNVDPRRFP